MSKFTELTRKTKLLSTARYVLSIIDKNYPDAPSEVDSFISSIPDDLKNDEDILLQIERISHALAR